MNPIEIIEKFGIPVAVAMAFGFFIWKQNQYIQKDLTKDIHEKFNRLEGNIVKLIDQQKMMQLEVKKMRGIFKANIEIIARLSGNGLKDKFMRIMEKEGGKDD